MNHHCRHVTEVGPLRRRARPTDADREGPPDEEPRERRARLGRRRFGHEECAAGVSARARRIRRKPRARTPRGRQHMPALRAPEQVRARRHAQGTLARFNRGADAVVEERRPVVISEDPHMCGRSVDKIARHEHREARRVDYRLHEIGRRGRCRRRVIIGAVLARTQHVGNGRLVRPRGPQREEHVRQRRRAPDVHGHEEAGAAVREGDALKQLLVTPAALNEPRNAIPQHHLKRDARVAHEAVLEGGRGDAAAEHKPANCQEIRLWRDWQHRATRRQEPRDAHHIAARLDDEDPRCRVVGYYLAERHVYALARGLVPARCHADGRRAVTRAQRRRPFAPTAPRGGRGDCAFHPRHARGVRCVPDGACLRPTPVARL